MSMNDDERQTCAAAAAQDNHLAIDYLRREEAFSLSMARAQKIELLRLALSLHAGRGAADEDIVETAKKFHDFLKYGSK